MKCLSLAAVTIALAHACQRIRLPAKLEPVQSLLERCMLLLSARRDISIVSNAEGNSLNPLEATGVDQLPVDSNVTHSPPLTEVRSFS